MGHLAENLSRVSFFHFGLWTEKKHPVKGALLMEETFSIIALLDTKKQHGYSSVQLMFILLAAIWIFAERFSGFHC